MGIIDREHCRALAARAVQATCSFGGRRLVYRVARFVEREAALDVPNCMETNGEKLLQRAVIDVCLGAGSAPTLIDVGANFGDWTLNAIRYLEELGYAESIQFLLIEPAPSAIERLRRQPFPPGVELIEGALSSEPGSAILHTSASRSSGAHSLHAKRSTRHETTELTVRVDTLDDICQSYSFSHVTMVKIDAEGHDLDVIKGGLALLRRQAVDVVQFEYNARWIDSRHYLRDVFDLAAELGYRCGKVTPFGLDLLAEWSPDLETFVEANYALVLPSLVERLPVVSHWRG